MNIKSVILNTVNNNYYINKIVTSIVYILPSKMLGYKWDEIAIKHKFKRIFGFDLNLDDPKTLNEKLQWLKLNIHKDSYDLCSDKYLARSVWKQYGEEHQIPLLYHTYNWNDITMDVIPDEPCIVKCSSGCGGHVIIRKKEDIDIDYLRKKCRIWLNLPFYYQSHEWQYRKVKSQIIIEKLLLDKAGNIPNDYKLHWFNGELEFVYCSVDRLGENYRCVYSPEWERIELEWVEKQDHKGLHGPDISRPASFEEMVRVGKEIAKDFTYVRTDFYDVDGKMYFGEITLFHGGGFDTMEPPKWDLYYGNKLRLPEKSNFKN